MDTRPAELAHQVWSLARLVGTPHGLRAVGITEQQIEQATAQAVARGLPSPRPLEHDALHAMLRAAWSGEPPQTA